MVLRLVQHKTTRDTLQPPYGDPAGLTDRWWHSRLLTGENSDWWSVTDESGSDVARVEVDAVSTVGSTYGVCAPAAGFTEIALIEVREDRRRGGIGIGTLHLLTKAYPGRTFAAFSEEADQFWAAAGWTKYLHADEPKRFRALFVSTS